MAMRSSGSGGLREWIESLIAGQAGAADTVTPYRAPLVACASADDPRFAELQRHIPGHLHPCDLLPGARSVCAFFLPFASKVVRDNARGREAAESWARAYVETNALLDEVCAALVGALRQVGVRAAWRPPTHDFDPVRLVSAWSHKSVAYIAGLGQFGRHHMLITRAGCAGRLGSIVLDALLVPSPPVEGNYCAYDAGCRTCVRRCPVGALTDQGLDRQRCYAQCQVNDARFPEWTADVCGKCVTGPCALRPARSNSEVERT